MIAITNTSAPTSAAASLHHDALVEDNVRALEEAARLLGALPPGEYAATSPLGATVGAHYRHVLDHYLCLLDGLATGLIHYEGRARDPRIEHDREAALALTSAINARLLALTQADLLRPARLRCMAGEAAERHYGELPTLPPRELHFVLLHAIHHFSFIAMTLRLRGQEVDPDFGVAPATRAWRRSQG